MALGFLLHNKRNEKVKVNCIIDSCLLLISLLILTVIILSAHIFSTPYISSSSTLLSNAIYMSLHRIGWALALAYIIFTCENQRRGSIIRWFLSHPYWKPIGTMGLSLYITHLIYMMFTMMNTKQVPFFSFWTVVSMNIGSDRHESGKWRSYGGCWMATNACLYTIFGNLTVLVYTLGTLGIE